MSRREADLESLNQIISDLSKVQDRMRAGIYMEKDLDTLTESESRISDLWDSVKENIENNNSNNSNNINSSELVADHSRQGEVDRSDKTLEERVSRLERLMECHTDLNFQIIDSLDELRDRISEITMGRVETDL